VTPETKTGSRLFSSQLDLDFQILRRLNTDYSSGDIGGDDSNSCARRTNSKAGNSRNTDTVGSRNTGTESSIHMDNIRSNPGLRTQLRSKLERQNAARERKLVSLPPIPLREVFSLFFLLIIKPESEGKVFRFILVQKPLDIL
jgi:hypothetical protein